MDIKLLKSDILSNNIPKFLIFIEEEQALAKQYLTAISKTLNKECKYYDTADNVIYDIQTNIKSDCIYVILNDKNLLNNRNYIESLRSLNKYIIVRLDSVDKSNNVYKEYKQLFVNFSKIDKYALLAYVQKKCKDNKISVNQDKLEQLIDNCNYDLGCIINELDKIITLSQENSNILFDYMLYNGFSDYRQTNVFLFINHIIAGDICVFSEKQRLVDSPMAILYNLYNTARNKFIKDKDSRCLRIMQICSQLYNSIIDGTLSDTYAIDYLLLRCFDE
jgi:DNA polymerase III delta subunit